MAKKSKTKSTKTEAKSTKTKSAKNEVKSEAVSTKSGGYDDAKDEVVKDLGTIETGNTRAGDIRVQVVRYNGGEAKVALLRVGQKADGSEWISARLGRLTAAEIPELLAKLKKASSYL